MKIKYYVYSHLFIMQTKYTYQNDLLLFFLTEFEKYTI